MVGNLVHPLYDSIHEWVKTLHDIKLLLKILDHWDLGLNVLNPSGDLRGLGRIILHPCMHLLSHAHEVSAHLLNNSLGFVSIARVHHLVDKLFVLVHFR